MFAAEQERVQISRQLQGEENGETEPTMKTLVVLKVVIFLMLLGQYQTFASRPHFSGVMLSKYEHEPVKRNTRVEEPISKWWNEDYSHPRRRRPVHNKLDP